jgi:hypothetical protein
MDLFEDLFAERSEVASVNQLVAGFDQTPRSAVGRALGMGRNGCGEVRDAMMCVVGGKISIWRRRAGSRRDAPTVEQRSRAGDQLWQ